MKKINAQTFLSPLGFTATLVTVSIALAAIGRLNRLDVQTWPGWVQAIGSIEAILVAVWVTWNQGEAQRARDEAAGRAEINGVVRSLRAEIETTLVYATSRIAEHLNNSQPGTAFTFLIPIPENPFPIFDALIPKLGIIPDDQIQREIIHTYAVAKSLAATIRQHNLFLNQFSAAEIRQTEQPYAVTDVAVRKSILELQTYSDSLRSEFEPSVQQMRALLKRLYESFPGN